MARVMALLLPYYTVDVPQGIRAIEAEDWLAALSDAPQWALTNAARWWKSDENPDRRRKPLEGDIAARVKREMGLVDVARLAVTRWDDGQRELPAFLRAPSVHDVPVEERRRVAAEIMGRAGFAPKHFGEAAE